MKKGIGLFGFIFGTVLGGVFALFTAKRKGSDVRKDFVKAIKNKENVLDLLIAELKGIGDETKKVANQIHSSEVVTEYKDMAKEKFDTLYAQAQEKIAHISSTLEELKEDVKTKFEEGKEKVLHGAEQVEEEIEVAKKSAKAKSEK